MQGTKKRLILQIINRFIFKKLIFYTVQSMIDTQMHIILTWFLYFEFSNPNKFKLKALNEDYLSN